MAVKAFDLNIEKILENWQVRHAVREIIANALDEQLLTHTRDVVISKDGDRWLIRDFGRGLRYSHLTQNENQEKLNAPGVIGRFGIGLKDALATFERNGVSCQIQSRYGKITTQQMSKQGFGDITTLHAVIDDPAFVGTLVTLNQLADEEVDAAKNMFLAFSGDGVLDTTKYGQIISHESASGKIFINGVLVAQEDNFLFSYNITHINTQLKKAINRERTHVGRSAYTETVKKILLASANADVANLLAEDMSGFSTGKMHDELGWIDVQEHAVTLLNKSGNIVFLTATESMLHPNIVDEARRNGTKIITIPDNLRSRLSNKVDDEGNPINDMTRYVQSYNESFRFEFIDARQLSADEQKVYSCKGKIIALYGGMPSAVADIKISQRLRPDILTDVETMGCWDPQSRAVVISRQCLSAVDTFAGVLIHELIHARTGFEDVSREFEYALTDAIGKLCQAAIAHTGGVATKNRPWYKFC